MPVLGLPVLGVDVGGVIISAHGDEDTSFWGSRPMSTPEVSGAIQGVAELADLFGGRVHLVTKAHARVESLTRQWLERAGFWRRTGIDPANMHVVRERVDKRPVCQRLAITHFIDDHLEVLADLASVRRRYWFAVGAGGPTRKPPIWAAAVNNWTRLSARVARDLH